MESNGVEWSEFIRNFTEMLSNMCTYMFFLFLQLELELEILLLKEVLTPLLYFVLPWMGGCPIARN